MYLDGEDNFPRNITVRPNVIPGITWLDRDHGQLAFTDSRYLSDSRDQLFVCEHMRVRIYIYVPRLT